MIRYRFLVCDFLIAVSCLLLAAGHNMAAAADKDLQEISVGKGGTLSFRLKDADVKSVLQIFAKQLGKNIVAGEGVTGRVTLSFSNVKPQEGLETVLRAKGYDWIMEGDTIIVSNKKMVRTYLLQYANASEVKNALDLLMAEGDHVSVNDSYNAIIVKAPSDSVGRVEKALKELDVPPVQVMVEARIMELKLTDDGNAGLDVKYTSPRNTNNTAQTKNLAGRPADIGAQGFYSQVISGNIEAYLSTVLTEVNYDLVASPRIATVNHKPATILIGQKLGYKTTITSLTSTTQQINFLETGTKLTITPHVSDDGFIRMTIYPKISDGTIINDLPVENTTETQNEVLVKSGQTIIIGGLTKNKETQTDVGVPILMYIPFLGGFFRKTTISNEKREMLVVITPTIMTPEYLKEMQNELNSISKRGKERGSSFIH